MMRKKYTLAYESDWQDSTYRYRLDASTSEPGSQRLVVIQINPSIAGTGTKSDPTVGKVCNWAIRRGFSKVSFLNLFAYRSTPQSGLIGQSFDRLVGPRNDEFLRNVLRSSATLFVGWGKPEGVSATDYSRRLLEVKRVVSNIPTFQIGPLVEGKYPRHGKCWNRPHCDDIQAFAWP